VTSTNVPQVVEAPLMVDSSINSGVGGIKGQLIVSEKMGIQNDL